MNVIDTINDLRELMFNKENIPLCLNQLDSNSLSIKHYILEMNNETCLLLLFYMYIENSDYKDEVTHEILQRNPCICFLNELYESEFWSHKILLIDLIKQQDLFSSSPVSKQICYKSNFCSANLNRLSSKTIIEVYKKLLSCDIFRITRHALLNINVKLNMKHFESYGYLENLFKDNLIFPYKLYFLLNFENEINDNQMFTVRSIFDTFYLTNNWKLKLLLAKEIRKIYVWDEKRGRNVLIYLKNLIIQHSKQISSPFPSNINFYEELAYKLMEGLVGLKETDLVLITVLDLFNLFNEKFQESCLETLKTISISGERQENLLREFLNQLSTSSLYIKFSILTILKGDSDTQSSFINKCIHQLHKPASFIKETGTKISKEFSTDFRILQAKNSFVKNWQTRKKLINCFEEIILSPNGISLFNNFLKESFLILFDDSVAEIRLSVFESYVNLVCKFGCSFIISCYEELRKLNKKEAKWAIAFSLIYGEFSVHFCSANELDSNHKNKYLKKAIDSIKWRNDNDKITIEAMTEKISDIVDSNALKWFGY